MEALGQLAKEVGLPIAMLIVALVTVCRYFIDGKVVPRWVHDAAIKERDETIIKLEAENKELKALAYGGVAAARSSTTLLEKAVTAQ